MLVYSIIGFRQRMQKKPRESAAFGKKVWNFCLPVNKKGASTRKQNMYHLSILLLHIDMKCTDCIYCKTTKM